MTPANIARATIEGVLWSLATASRCYGSRSARSLPSPHWRRVSIRGATQIATAVFGLPIVVTDTFESVAVGSARQAAWAFTGTLRLACAGDQQARADGG